MFDQNLSVKDLSIAALYVINLLQPGALVFLIGQLGVGKTTLCKEIVNLIGISGKFCSPTFNYKNYYGVVDENSEFRKITNCDICHFDLYRVCHVEQLYTLNLIESLMEDNNICFVEWPSVLLNMHQFDNKMIILVKISYANNEIEGSERRRIIVEKKVDRKSNLFDI